MGILQSMRHGFSAPSRADAGRSQDHADDAEAVDSAEGRAIAERQALFNGTLDEVADLVAQLGRMSPMVEKLRQPMADEFETYRRAHSELAYLKSHNANLERLLVESRSAESNLQEAVTGQEQQVAQTRLENEQLRMSAEAATLDLINQREALARANLSAKELTDTLQSSNLRCSQLEEDGSTLRSQVDQGAERRRELDAIVARVRQDALLASEESSTLRRKVEELAEQLARAARSEGQAQAEATKERERSLLHRAEAERAETDLAAMAHKMDEQASVARQEITALSTRLETTNARSGKLDRMLGELNAKLLDSAGQRRAAEGRASDLQLALDRAREKGEHLERAVTEHRTGQEALDRARLTALERGDQLALSLRTQEIALQRSEQRFALLQDKHASLSAEMEQLRRSQDDERIRLEGELKRAEAELNLWRSGPSKSSSRAMILENDGEPLSQTG